MSFIDEKYISLVSSRLQKFTKKKQVYIISVVIIAETPKSKKAKQEDIYIKLKMIIITNVIIVGQHELLTNFLKDLTLAQDVMKYDFAKGQADAAVAIAGYAGPVTKATFENQGLEKATNLTTKLSEGLININKISADIGLKYATLAQTKEIAQMKAAGATTGQIPKDKETNNQYLGRKNVINNINEIQTLLKDPQFSRLIGPETQFTPDIFNNLRTNFPQLSAKLARIQAIEFELGGKNLTKNEIDILRPIYSWKGITAGALNERLKLVKEDFADRNAIVEIRFPGLAPVGQKIDD